MQQLPLRIEPFYQFVEIRENLHLSLINVCIYLAEMENCHNIINLIFKK